MDINIVENRPIILSDWQVKHMARFEEELRCAGTNLNLVEDYEVLEIWHDITSLIINQIVNYAEGLEK